MIKQYVTISISLIVLFFISSCSPRYIKYQRATKKVQNSEITSEQFDEKFYKFSKTKKKYSSSDTTLPIKFGGSYVNQDTDGKYRVYKFLPEGKVISTGKMDIYPNETTFLFINSDYDYYRLDGNQIEIEYMMVRDWNLYNIIMTGDIKNDTIVFYQTKNQQIFWKKAKRINKVYVYDNGLTVTPY
jgi:hypothetical protein